MTQNHRVFLEPLNCFMIKLFHSSTWNNFSWNSIAVFGCYRKLVYLLPLWRREKIWGNLKFKFTKVPSKIGKKPWNHFVLDLRIDFEVSSESWGFATKFLLSLTGTRTSYMAGKIILTHLPTTKKESRMECMQLRFVLTICSFHIQALWSRWYRRRYWIQDYRISRRES